MKTHNLFRKEAVDHRLNRSLGTARINIPFNYQLTAALAVILVAIIVAFIGFAHISEQTFVKGYLDSDGGVITVYSKDSGVITQSLVEEGKQISKGDVLFIISNSNREATKILIHNLSQRIFNLKQQYQLKNDHYQALKKLNDKNYVSVSVLKETESELLEIKNKIKFEELELIKCKQSRYQFIKSPADGIATNIFFKKEQIVEASKSLLQIIPSNSTLIAQLYIPSRNMGFLKKGDSVMIKYDAYPSERFGSYKAVIQEVNLTILTDAKEDKPLQVGEPYYKVKAALEQPYVNLYGKKEQLSHGMTLTAVTTGKQKKIWQWILDPVYSFYGNTF